MALRRLKELFLVVVGGIKWNWRDFEVFEYIYFF